jgi:hypothetical protein
MASYNIILGQRPKTFDLINGNYSLTFDMVTGGHTTACDVIVHNLASRTVISPSSAFVLDCCLTKYNLSRTLALQRNEMELVSRIDKLIEICQLMINSVGTLHADATSIVQYWEIPDASIMTLFAALDGVYYKINSQFDSSFILSIDDINIVTKLLTDILDNPMYLSTKIEATNAEKTIGVQSDAALSIEASALAEKNIGEVASDFVLFAEATAIIGHYRTLAEVDGESELNTLSSWDDMSLVDIGLIEA